MAHSPNRSGNQKIKERLERRLLRPKRMPSGPFSYIRREIIEFWQKNSNKVPFNIDKIIARTIVYKLVDPKNSDSEFSTLIQHAVVGAAFVEKIKTDIKDIFNYIHINLLGNINPMGNVLRYNGSKYTSIVGEYDFFTLSHGDYGDAPRLVTGELAINIDKQEEYIEFILKTSNTKIEKRGFCIIDDDKIIFINFYKSMRSAAQLSFLVARIPREHDHDTWIGAFVDASDNMIYSFQSSMFIILRKSADRKLIPNDVNDFFNITSELPGIHSTKFISSIR